MTNEGIPPADAEKAALERAKRTFHRVTKEQEAQQSRTAHIERFKKLYPEGHQVPKEFERRLTTPEPEKHTEK